MPDAGAPRAEIMIPRIDPQTGWVSPDVLPPGAGTGGGEGGGGPQSATWFYPGALTAQLGVAAYRLPPTGAVIVGVSLQADFSEAGRVILDVRLAGAAAYRFDTVTSRGRYAAVSIPAAGGERLTIDVVAVSGDTADSKPRDVVVQVWWRYP